MKMNVFKWVSVFAVVLWFSSCSMEKRLYSSGFHIQWNAKGSGSINNDKVKAPKQSSLKVATNEIDTVSPSVVADCRDVKELTSKDGSVSASMRPVLCTGNHRIVKGPATYHTNINSAAVPKPRKGETVEQMAQRKTHKARIYGILALATIILFYPAIVFAIIHSVLKNQAQKLDPNYENVNNGPTPRPGETTEELAQRKANQSLLFGILSIPTSVFLIGIAFGVIAISNGSEAKMLSPNNGKIRKRANAGITWSVVGFILCLLMIIWMSILLSGDLFI
jgi:hypothetical protein